jgi:hypothetical protein
MLGSHRVALRNSVTRAARREVAEGIELVNMIRGERVGEDDDKETAAQEAELQRRLADIRHQHRPRVHWRVTKHTAEMAIRALSDSERRDYRRSSKSRRRKPGKRML